MDITAQSVEQLKALAYDQLKERNRIEQNLALIEQELARRAVIDNPPVEGDVEPA